MQGGHHLVKYSSGHLDLPAHYEIDKQWGVALLHEHTIHGDRH